MTTQSGSFPPNLFPRIHSFSHKWVRAHKSLFKKMPFPDIDYHEVSRWELDEIIALHKEWFPVTYSDSMFGSIGISIKSIGAYLNITQFRKNAPPLLIGLILFTISPNQDNSYLSLTYFMQNTNSAYIISVGVIEEMRGHGIATALIQKCKEKCEASELKPLFISLHVTTYNTQAIPLYEKLGFKRRKLLKKHYTVRGQKYDSYFYILYINNASEPILSFKNLVKMIRILKKTSRCLRKCCGLDAVN